MANTEISAEIAPVGTADELRDVQRFKYDVYVAEMVRYGARLCGNTNFSSFLSKSA